MITKEQIIQLMADHLDSHGNPDPLEVVSWEPFTLRKLDDEWEGTDIPAGMILARAVLSQVQ